MTDPATWSNDAIWGIAAMSIAGVIVRPFDWPEFVWATAGAASLVLFGLLPPAAAWSGIASGLDVYLFLTGMMLLSELARTQGLFDWLAAHAARHARGDARRLFSLVFAAGTVVTILLSNDATAVVLTPAVAAAARAAKIDKPLPYLLVCALVANAASFVLPISNPANLVLYSSHIPSLLQWLARYAAPSAAAVAATYAVLRWTQRAALAQHVTSEVEADPLGPGGRMAAIGLAIAVAALLTASAAGLSLGWPTLLAALLAGVLVSFRARQSLRTIVGGISWGVLPLVAGLFVLVQALDRTGLIHTLATALHALAGRQPSLAAWVAGGATALLTNAVNNLPAGLVAGRVIDVAPVPDRVRAALLIAVDLGPNLSVTGSLATILWLQALRRDGLHVGAWTFLKLGALIMPPALLLALAALYVGR